MAEGKKVPFYISYLGESYYNEGYKWPGGVPMWITFHAILRRLLFTDLGLVGPEIKGTAILDSEKTDPLVAQLGDQ